MLFFIFWGVGGGKDFLTVDLKGNSHKKSGYMINAKIFSERYSQSGRNRQFYFMKISRKLKDKLITT
jgi:hypothetical protein